MLVNMVEKREETFFSCSFVLSGSIQDPGGRKAVSLPFTLSNILWMRPVGGTRSDPSTKRCFGTTEGFPLHPRTTFQETLLWKGPKDEVETKE